MDVRSRDANPTVRLVSRRPVVTLDAGHIAIFSQYRGFFELDSVSVTGVPDLDLLRPVFVQRELAKLGL